MNYSPTVVSMISYVQIYRLLEKISINIGLGEAVGNPNLIKGAVEELSAIAGQKAVVTRAKKSIATFKLREGMPIGCMVTLRGVRMWEFLDRLVSLKRLTRFCGMSVLPGDWII